MTKCDPVSHRVPTVSRTPRDPVSHPLKGDTRGTHPEHEGGVSPLLGDHDKETKR